MNIDKAKEFIKKKARPIDLAVYNYYFENGSKEAVINELMKYQNPDGGFGHALEADNWNPNSNPIATNDAIITLYSIKAIDKDSEIVKGIIKYIDSLDSFDKEKKCWLFAIDSNKDYPHAIWWEKKDDGINSYNPTVSLASFMLSYGINNAFYQNIIKDAYIYLKDGKEIGSDSIKCYMLSYEFLSESKITNIVDLTEYKKLIDKRLIDIICKDTSKYGVEYVATPSSYFNKTYSDFKTDEICQLIETEKAILFKQQKEDGGFDITWKWYTSYKEFEKAREDWRGRITIEKLLFYLMDEALGKIVTVTVDRPLGSYHPKHKNLYYPINYGYIDGLTAPDNSYQDAYILGVQDPIKEFRGRVIAIIHREDDVEEKWVVAKDDDKYTKEEIKQQTNFVEQFFKSSIRM